MQNVKTTAHSLRSNSFFVFRRDSSRPSRHNTKNGHHSSAEPTSSEDETATFRRHRRRVSGYEL